MQVNIQSIINRLRNESPLLGRNARQYIADALEGLFTSHISHHGVSATTANVIEKVVTNVTPGFDVEEGTLVMRRGTKISVVFDHGNTVANPTLRVGAAAARPIIHLSNWPAGATVEFVLDGQNWRMINAKRTTNITPQMDAAWDATAVIGTDNGQYANADHVHPANTQQHTDHIVAGRLHLDRLPTSEVANRVLAVGEANTSPSFVQATDPMIADDAVRTHHILDLNVTEPKLADDSVSTRTIIDRNVTEPKLADDSVSTRTIIDRNVTEPKLANDAVSTRTILDENVTTEKIADRAVIGSKLFTSAESNRVLRVGEAGTDPVFDLINMETDFSGTLPVERGGTGADNPEEARYNLQVLSNISPITGGQMRRIVLPVSPAFTVNEASMNFMTIPQLADRTGHVAGTVYTDGYLVGTRAYTAITYLDWGGTNLTLQTRTLNGTWSGSGIVTHLILMQHLPVTV